MREWAPPLRHSSMLLILAAALCSPASAHSQFEARPTPSLSAQPTFPRVSGLPQKQMDRANAILASRELQDRNARKECLLANSSPRPHASWHEEIRTAYLSPRLLSIDVRSSWDGCSAYPNRDVPTPVTIDLVQGKALKDWSLFFTDGFLRPQSESPASLWAIYLRHAHLDGECLGVMKNSGGAFTVWLDSQDGLMAQPVLPHAVQACAVLISIPFAEIQREIREPAVREDLLAASFRKTADRPRKPLP